MSSKEQAQSRSEVSIKQPAVQVNLNNNEQLAKPVSSRLSRRVSHNSQRLTVQDMLHLQRTVINKKLEEILDPKVNSLPENLKNQQQVTKKLVDDLIGKNDTKSLETLYRSKLFPLWAWEQDAWVTFLDWNTSK